MSATAIISIVGCVIAGIGTAAFLIARKLKENKELREKNIRMEERANTTNAPPPPDDRTIYAYRDGVRVYFDRIEHRWKPVPPEPTPYYPPPPVQQAPVQNPPPPPAVEQPTSADSAIVSFIKALSAFDIKGPNTSNNVGISSYAWSTAQPETYWNGMTSYHDLLYGSSNPNDVDKYFSRNPFNQARLREQERWGYMNNNVSYPGYVQNPYPNYAGPFKVPSFAAYDQPSYGGGYMGSPQPASYYQPGYQPGYQSGYNQFGNMSYIDRELAEKTARIDPATGIRYDGLGRRLYIDDYNNVQAEPHGGYHYDIYGNQYDAYNNMVRPANMVPRCYQQERDRAVQYLRSCQGHRSYYQNPYTSYGWGNPQPQNGYYNQQPSMYTSSGVRYPTMDEVERWEKSSYPQEEYNFFRRPVNSGVSPMEQSQRMDRIFGNSERPGQSRAYTSFAQVPPNNMFAREINGMSPQQMEALFK